ncbi:hypothetical protein BDZ45DRAFT_755206 [Acephala macrosclerotiorum]|nr:hypothetical protein BDZ45DRAFT_755206 [Acephala macrosclerotiorum]
MLSRVESYITAICLLGFFVATRHLASTFSHSQSSRFSIIPRAAGANGAGFDANLDIYGFGIRLGIYLQWVGAVLSKWFNEDPECLRDLLDENSIFQLAIFIASILLCTGNTESPWAVELLILLHIFFGSSFILHFDAEISDNCQFDFWGILVKYAITLGMAALNVWFWYAGMHKLPATPGTGNHAFFFHNFAVGGSILVFFQVVAISNLILWWNAFFGSVCERLVYLHILNRGQQNSRYIQVLTELCTPSSEKFKNIPPDVNLFRLLTKLLFKPNSERLAAEMEPWLNEIINGDSFVAQIDPTTSPTGLLVNVLNASGNGWLGGYLVWVLCDCLACTHERFEERRRENTEGLTDAQEKAIRDYTEFLASHPNALIQPPFYRALAPHLRIALFLAGFGPSIIGMIMTLPRTGQILSRIRPDNSEKNFPRMVDLVIRMHKKPPTSEIDNDTQNQTGRGSALGFASPATPREQREHGRFHFCRRYFRLIFDPILKFWQDYFAKFFQASVLTLSIMGIEFIIKWNGIRNAYNIKSTGQVIPLIIGAGGILKVIFQILLSKASPADLRRVNNNTGSSADEAGPTSSLAVPAVPSVPIATNV